MMKSLTTIVETSILPSSIDIKGNFPNPFNPETTILFDLLNEGIEHLEVYNIMGQKVRTLISNTMSAGNNSVRWDGRNDGGIAVSTGIYFTLLTAGKQQASNKMMLLK